MHIHHNTRDDAKIVASRDELNLLVSVIRETWEAVPDSDFKSRTGETVERALAIRDQLYDTRKKIDENRKRRGRETNHSQGLASDEATLSISLGELNFLCGAIDVALKARSKYDFELLTGHTVERAQSMGVRLREICDEMESQQ